MKVEQKNNDETFAWLRCTEEMLSISSIPINQIGIQFGGATYTYRFSIPKMSFGKRFKN